MCISKLATTGQTTPCIVRLLGLIDDHEVLILVDSGSSHSFISDAVAEKFADRISKMAPVAIKVADGGILSCLGYIQGCKWTTQRHAFTTDLRVLPLGCYDMVIGMDWLKSCGPMLVD